MSKEKQIEEMARTLCGEKELACRDCGLCEFWLEASQLYNAGYRKQSEGEWVEKPSPWEMDGSHTYVCSVCNEQISVLGNPLPYCCFCGAKMKGGE